MTEPMHSPAGQGGPAEPVGDEAPAMAGLAPGVPADYYERIHQVEGGHWWHRGMREISAALLGERLRSGGRILDAGCGTGGFLRWALDHGSFESACGIDVAAVALEFAGQVVPEAELRAATLDDIPYPTAWFKLIVVNDVLQHVPEDDLPRSVGELGRVLAPGGTVLVRTNGARRAWRARADWRVFDRDSLRSALEGTNLRCERLTHANTIGSALGSLRGHAPQPPSEHGHGVPADRSGPSATFAYAMLAAEARYLARPTRSLPWGHTLLAVASAP